MAIRLRAAEVPVGEIRSDLTQGGAMFFAYDKTTHQDGNGQVGVKFITPCGECPKERWCFKACEEANEVFDRMDREITKQEEADARHERRFTTEVQL
jgi:hypothetical protein